MSGCRSRIIRGPDVVEARHATIHDHDVGIRRRGEYHGIVAVGGEASHVDCGFGFEDPPACLAHQCVIINHETRIFGAVSGLFLPHPGLFGASWVRRRQIRRCRRRGER